MKYIWQLFLYTYKWVYIKNIVLNMNDLWQKEIAQNLDYWFCITTHIHKYMHSVIFSYFEKHLFPKLANYELNCIEEIAFYTYLHKKVLWVSTSLFQVWVLQSDLLWLVFLSQRFWSEEMGTYTLSLITLHKFLVLSRHKNWWKG